MSDAKNDPQKDRETFETLYRQGRHRLLASLAGLVRDRDRAEDITASAFHTAWEKRAQFRGDSSLGTWLYAIGRNAARRSWREERPAHRDPVDRLETGRYAEPDRVSAALEEGELRDQVWKTLDRIPAKCRQLLIDHYIDGRSLREIAHRDRVPIGTVGSRLFAARRLFQRAWQTTGPLRTPMPEKTVRQIAEEALTRLAEELQAGRSDALKNYLGAMGRFHRYSWNNILLIQTQRPTATRVAGFHTWRQLERSVKKGEKGIMIFAPIVIKDHVATANVGSALPKEVERLSGFRTAYVFDIEQTAGRPLPELSRTTGDPMQFTDRLKAAVAARGIALTYDPSIAPADGQSSGGEIRVRPGLSPAEEFSVIAHELAHEILHHRADRAGLTKVVRETQAEAVAFVVSRGIGLETNTAARDYIALYNGDKNTLAESLHAIQDTSARILGDLLEDERSPTTQKTTERPDRPSEGSDRSDRSAPLNPAASSVISPPDPSDSLSQER